MDDLCNLFINSCSLQKPVLYDMMIFDFKDLSEQYINNTGNYIFNMNPNFEYTLNTDIDILISYLSVNNTAETILISMIKKRFGENIFIDINIINSMVDYYIECININ